MKFNTILQDKVYIKRVSIIGIAMILIILGSIVKSNYTPAKWMTYRDFDVKGQKNFINYLAPGVKDSSTGKKYDFTQKHYTLLFIILFFFFPFMFFIRVLLDLDFKLGVYRYITQWLTFVTARLGIFRVTGICPVKRTGLGVFPVINCQSCELATGACPLGTFQMSLLNRQIPYILIGQLLIAGILSGRWLCGWICPYGFLSDIFDKLPGKRIKVHLKFTYIKYISLGVFLITSISYFFRPDTNVLFYCTFICPAGFYYGVLEYALTTGVHNLIKQFPYIHYMLVYHFIKAALVIVGSIKLGGRFYCKFLCPLGAFYGLFSKIALLRIKLNSNKCTACKKCKEVCPMKISVLDRRHLATSSCISCGRCKKVCPTNKIEYTINLAGNVPAKAKP